MTMFPMSRLLPARFARETRGSVSIETLIMFPMLMWAMVSTVVFFDGFRARNQTQVAAQTVADLLSRSTNAFTTDYLEGMNDVFDFLADSRHPTRLRISSVIWNSTAQRNALQWSYGTRGFSALPSDTFDYLAEGDMSGLIARFGEIEGFNFTAAAAQAPIPELAQRIPPVLPGEALIMVESFAMWTPFANVGVGQIRFNPVVVTRPRFSPWINLEGAIEIFPEGNYEVTFAGYVPSLPPPEPPPEPEPETVSTVVNQDFDSGVTTGWSHSTLTSTSRPGTGTYLGPFSGETWDNPVTRSINLGSSTLASAQIEFDLLIIDSWDSYDPAWTNLQGDVFSILINGAPIYLDPFGVNAAGGMMSLDRHSVTNHGGSVYTVSMTRTQFGTNFAGNLGPEDWLRDEIWRVTIDIQAPPETFTLGFRASLDGGVLDESFGIDNFRVRTSIGNRVPAAFTPNPATVTGTDPFTRYNVHSGCPDHRLPANWLTFRNSNIWTGKFDWLRLTRRAGGSQNLANCNIGVSGFGRISAQPSLVLNYTNDSGGWNGERLRIRMDDGNNGWTCDTTILIRDPFGQYSFNDDLPGFGYNAGLALGNAPSGIYHIWFGTWGTQTCNARLKIERY